jgi:ATP-dependent exoDNAse (exonuclease V) beta subunit
VHRAKGMEYDMVYLVNDFLSEAKLLELKDKHEKDKTAPFNIAKLNEDINLLYVAVTRARQDLYIPEALVPITFQTSPHIHIEKEQEENNTKSFQPYNKTTYTKDAFGSKQLNKEKNYTSFKKREINKDASKPWTSAQDNELKDLYEDGWSINALTTHFNKTKGAIVARLKRFNYFTD